MATILQTITKVKNALFVPDIELETIEEARTDLFKAEHLLSKGYKLNVDIAKIEKQYGSVSDAPIAIKFFVK